VNDFAAQHRGALTDYDRYLEGMDASMRQKVALTAAHLFARGRVADMGMGSGAGSHALAALYPDLDVVGVDVDPTMVAEYGLDVCELWELGGRYHPTPGATPEVVHPLAAWVSEKSDGRRALHWVPLAELARGPEELLVDGHLRIAALRAAHALRLLGG
jgi:hypothetical protein